MDVGVSMGVPQMDGKNDWKAQRKMEENKRYPYDSGYLRMTISGETE